jgi:hypothetical protein
VKKLTDRTQLCLVLTAIGITDISRIKWAENLQERRLREAEETRRAQNSFIDITSHEMRNPLSKTLHSVREFP